MSFFRPGPFFDPFNDEVPAYPIQRLPELQQRAKYLLRDRTVAQLKKAADMVGWLIADYFEEEKEQWITRQLEIGGSVLRFLSYEERTERGLKELIADSYNPEIVSELNFPQENNTSELTAIEGSLGAFKLDDNELPGAQPFEYLAVLALEQIASAMDEYQDGRGEDWPPAMKADAPRILLKELSNNTINAMETVCRAEELKSRAELEHSHFNARISRAIDSAFAFAFVDAEQEHKKKVDILVKEKLSLAAARAASARHKENREQKSAALADWDATGHTFSSMRAFARNRYREYGVTDFTTVYNWLRYHQKAKTSPV